MPLSFDVSFGALAPGSYDCQISILDPATQKTNFWRVPILTFLKKDLSILALPPMNREAERAANQPRHPPPDTPRVRFTDHAKAGVHKLDPLFSRI